MNIINFRLKGLTARLYESLGMRGQVSEAEQIYSKDAILSQKQFTVFCCRKKAILHIREARLD